MKKKLCLALSVLMVMMTLLSPMAVFAEKKQSENSKQTTKVEQTEDSKDQQKADNSDENKTQADKKTETNQQVTQYQQYTPVSTIEENTVSVIFTGGINSNLTGDGGNGGFAKLKTVFNEISPSYEDDSFVLDAGNFSMGGIFQPVYADIAPELRMMAKVGYDATVLGSNEFEYGAEGLSDMLLNAVKLSKADGTKLPKICEANIDSKEKRIKKAFRKYKVKDEYAVIKKNDMKIAVFGLTDEDADTGEIDLEASKEQAEAVISKISSKEKNIEMVVCLFSGDKDSSESLAENVDGIDMIICGGCDKAISKPETVSKTLIVSAGPNTKYAGHITFKKNDETGSLTKDEYKLIKVSSKVTADSEISSEVDKMVSEADSRYYKKYGFRGEQKLTYNGVSFTEETIGYYIADAFRDGSKKGSADGKVAVVSRGSINTVPEKGSIRTSDAFNLFDTGYGSDGKAGISLVSLYVTGEELKNIVEIDATISEKEKNAALYFSGVTYSVNKHRIKNNRAFDIKLTDGEIKDEGTYRIITDMNTAELIMNADEMSNGRISVTPKDSNGDIVLDLKEQVVKKDNTEMKAWAVVASYLDSRNSISKAYASADGRKSISESRSLREIFCQPNRAAVVIRLLVLIPIALILIIIIIFWFRKHRRRSNMMFSISEREKRAIFAPPKKQKNLFGGNRRNRHKRNGRY